MIHHTTRCRWREKLPCGRAAFPPQSAGLLHRMGEQDPRHEFPFNPLEAAQLSALQEGWDHIQHPRQHKNAQFFQREQLGTPPAAAATLTPKQEGKRQRSRYREKQSGSSTRGCSLDFSECGDAGISRSSVGNECSLS